MLKKTIRKTTPVLRRSAVLAITALSLAALPAASAQASPTLPTPVNRTVAMQWARDYWRAKGRTSVCGRVYWRVAPLPSDTLGVTVRSLCEVVLNSREDWGRVPGGAMAGERIDPFWRFCAAAIHEWGHVVGRGHSHTPGMIMTPAESMNFRAWWYPYYPACNFNGSGVDR